MTEQSGSDERKAVLAAGGDDGALEFLFAKYKNHVRAIARRYFLIGADDEDIIQEGMIGLYKAIRDFDPAKSPVFAPFADLCIRRQILTAIKTAARQKNVPLNTFISFSLPADGDESGRTLVDELVPDVEADPEVLFIRKEMETEFAAKVNGMLSDLERRILSLFLRGESYREISEKLNKPEKAVDNALQRVKKKLLSGM